MKVRNAGLAAVATGLRKELKDYRGRVKGKIGEEAEERLYYGTQSKEIEETVIDENGEEKLVKTKSDDVIDDLEIPSELSPIGEYIRRYKNNANYDIYSCPIS